MTSLTDRLRGIMRPGGGATSTPARTADSVASGPEAPDSAECDLAARGGLLDVLGGVWLGDTNQGCLVVEREYHRDHRHGRMLLGEAEQWESSPRRALLLGDTGLAWPPGRALFFDLETTGLAGGAGTYAFLVGCGWFEEGRFRIRQFFLSSFGAERRVLAALAEVVEGASAFVTYNGKTFDLPLIETRYQLHRLSALPAIPHLDMLHVARRLWRTDAAPDGESSCRLTSLERTLCGHLRHGDVPGFEIPSRYFEFVRSGDARPLAPVLEHNRLDLLSLALVTAQAARLLDVGPAAARTAREAVGLARLYERGNTTESAAAAFTRALDLPGDVATHAEALRGLAILARRNRRYAEAADAWRRILALRSCPPAYSREATEALAIHHEHRLRDYATARRLALQSLAGPASQHRVRAAQHRLARLERKLGTHTPPADVGPPLF